MRVESSLIISPTDFKLGTLLDDPVKNNKYYMSLHLEKAILINQISATEALVELGAKVLLIDTKEGTIKYFVQYAFSSFQGVKLITQIALWADKDYNLPRVGSERVIDWTFFSHLLPKADGIAADLLQTPLGKKFWFRRIDDALGKNLRVIAIIRDAGVVVEITSREELLKIEKEVWGTLPKHEHRWAVITKKPILHTAISVDEFFK